LETKERNEMNRSYKNVFNFIILQVSDRKDNEYIFLTGVNYIFFKL
jgi:hypothetical protein